MAGGCPAEAGSAQVGCIEVVTTLPLRSRRAHLGPPRLVNSTTASYWPNPFNPATTIGFGIQNKSNVKITILNAIGEEVAVLVNEVREPGSYNVRFNAANLPSGVYFYQLKAGSFVQTKKMILLK